MAAMTYQWGNDVFCGDGDDSCGKLSHVVVDPKSGRVSDLIVEQGLLIMKKTWVVPHREVQQTTDEGIWLRSSEEDLSRFPPYKRREIEEVAPGYQGSSPGASPTAGGSPQGAVPIVRRVIHDGVSSDELLVLEKGVEVRNQQKQETVGKLERIVVDGESGEITQLVVNTGLFGDNVAYAAPAVQHFDEDRILVEGPASSLSEAEPEDRAEVEAPTASLPLPTQVEIALKEDERTRDEVIEIVERQKVVTLVGEVESFTASKAAEEIAIRQPGVLLVHNNLKIRS